MLYMQAVPQRLWAHTAAAVQPNACLESAGPCLAAPMQVGDYAFTTLAPQLGVVPAPNPIDEPIVVADIPGLIEGAHEVRG